MSVIYRARDYPGSVRVANVKGSSCDREAQNRYLKAVEDEGIAVATHCQIRDCLTKRDEGLQGLYEHTGHMFISHKKHEKYHWLLPICRKCNHPSSIHNHPNFTEVKETAVFVRVPNKCVPKQRARSSRASFIPASPAEHHDRWANEEERQEPDEGEPRSKRPRCAESKDECCIS